MKIIHNRTLKKIEKASRDIQMGFRNGIGIREALYGMNYFPKIYDIDQEMYTCFIDFEKAFDKL